MKTEMIKKHYGFFTLALFLCVFILSLCGISFSHWADEIHATTEIKNGEMKIDFKNKNDSHGLSMSEDGSLIVDFKYNSVVPFVLNEDTISDLNEKGYEIDSLTINGKETKKAIFPAKEKGRGSITLKYTGDLKEISEFKIKFDQYTQEKKRNDVGCEN